MLFFKIVFALIISFFKVCKTSVIKASKVKDVRNGKKVILCNKCFGN